MLCFYSRYMKKRGFTLVEMLIVVVIIWILASAILPRITGAMSRARDIKRQVDLRNIAAAITVYWEKYWTLPQRHLTQDSQLLIAQQGNPPSWEGGVGWVFSAMNYYGSVDGLSKTLWGYISSIPDDPLKTSRVNIHFDSKFSSKYREKMNTIAIKKWQYVYQVYKNNWIEFWWALLIAKVENADYANYVLIQDGLSSLQTKTFLWVYFDFVHYRNDLKNLHLCTSVEKVKRWEEKYEVKDDESVECTYSSEDQLYYIVKIE